MDPVTGRRASVRRGLRLFTAGVERSLRALRGIAPEVYAIGGTPLLERPPQDCLGSRRATMGTCVRGLEDRLRRRNAAWRKVAARAGVHFVDPLPWMCDGDRCPLVIGGVIVYRDADHLTSSFIDTVEGPLLQALALQQ